MPGIVLLILIIFFIPMKRSCQFRFFYFNVVNFSSCIVKDEEKL